jgi:hypothetical protein
MPTILKVVFLCEWNPKKLLDKKSKFPGATADAYQPTQ